MNSNYSEIYTKLAQDAGIINWIELERHFARGSVIVVDPDLDLIDVAVTVACDDSATLSARIADGRVKRACDEDARKWQAVNACFSAVVVAPYVLVQPAEAEAGSNG